MVMGFVKKLTVFGPAMILLTHQKIGIMDRKVLQKSLKPNGLGGIGAS